MQNPDLLDQKFQGKAEKSVLSGSPGDSHEHDKFIKCKTSFANDDWNSLRFMVSSSSSRITGLAFDGMHFDSWGKCYSTKQCINW